MAQSVVQVDFKQKGVIEAAHERHSVGGFSTWFTAMEIAEHSKKCGMKLMPTTKRRVNSYIKRHDWFSIPGLTRNRDGSRGGGGTEYHISLLPPELIAYLQAEAEKRRSKTDSKTAMALEEGRQKELVTTDLTARQRSVMEARAGLLNKVEQAQIRLGQSRRQAIMSFLEWLKTDITDEAAGLVVRANDRAGKLSTVSYRTLYNWFKLRDEDGVSALAPNLTRKADDLPEWFDGFLAHFARPQKPAVAKALRDYTKLLPDPSKAPNYDQVQRALKKLDKSFGTIARHRGREGRLALKARMAYVIRSTEGLLPSSVYTADGQTFDAEIAHPIHGQAFRPEITSILDVATRKCVGYSVGLSENTIVIIDALRMACVRYGIPAIFYVDRGSGYKNSAIDNELTGFAARLGITKMHALPQNSQAKGLIERFNGTVLVPLAKSFPTYIGADMDREAGQKVHKITRKELREFGTSKTLPSWKSFLAAMDEEMADYNNRPHSSLDGTTPNEAWANHVADGFQPVEVTQAEEEDLFRPYVKRKTNRALVEWLKNKYFHQALEGHHGTYVLVGYDIHDAQHVWVREIDMTEDGERPGRLICIAEFAGNEERYIPVTMEQKAMENRHKARKNRLQKHMDQVDAELSPVSMIEQSAQPVFELTEPAKPALIINNDAPVARMNDAGVPIFKDDLSLARWALENPEILENHHRAVLRDCINNPAARDQFRLEDIDLTSLANIVRSTPESD